MNLIALEWYEIDVGPDTQTIIDAILGAKKVTIRHEGQQYYKDRVVAPAEIERIRQVITVFKTM